MIVDRKNKLIEEIPNQDNKEKQHPDENKDRE